MENFMLLLTRLGQTGCRMDLVRRFSEALPRHDPKYTQALAAWLETGESPCLDARGITTQNVIQRLGIDYPHAVSLMLWIEEDPDKALPALSSVVNHLNR